MVGFALCRTAWAWGLGSCLFGLGHHGVSIYSQLCIGHLWSGHLHQLVTISLQIEEPQEKTTPLVWIRFSDTVVHQPGSRDTRQSGVVFK